jgi:SH3-like domain-containing protein
LPVEVTAEFDTWRRIRDADGTEGWVYHSLLTGRRTATVITKSKENLVPLFKRANLEGAVVAQLERGVIGHVKRCKGGWCSFSGRGFDGWVQQAHLWGVYPDETVE